MNENISDSTFKIIDELMQETLNKELYENPFIKEVHRANNPLFASILPDEIFKVSHFERRFNSVFNCIWEKLAVAAGKVGMGEAYQEYVINGHLRKERQSRIQEVLNRLEHKEKGKERIKPNWESEIKYILEGKGELIPTTVVCDVYAKNIKTGSAYAFELKAPLPNSDQTKVSKEKIFKLLSMEEPQVNNAFLFYLIIHTAKKKIIIGHFQKDGLICRMILSCSLEMSFGISLEEVVLIIYLLKK
jgi:hypothetical protein